MPNHNFTDSPPLAQPPGGLTRRHVLALLATLAVTKSPSPGPATLRALAELDPERRVSAETVLVDLSAETLAQIESLWSRFWQLLAEAQQRVRLAALEGGVV